MAKKFTHIPNLEVERNFKNSAISNHLTMERIRRNMSTLGCTALVLGALTVGLTVNNYVGQENTTAIYNSSVSTSVSGTTVTTEQVFVSDDGKRALALLKFANGATMPTDASNYQAFISGATLDSTNSARLTALDQPMDGKIISFGSTGYLGVYLEAEKPFTEQMIHIVMRSNKTLSTDSEALSRIDGDLLKDESFKKYDQWRFGIDPSATTAVKTSALDGDTVDVGALYNSLVTAPAEEAIKAKMQDTLSQMRYETNAMNDYAQRLGTYVIDGSAVAVPEKPSVLAGDSITCANNDTKLDQCAPEDLRHTTTTPLASGYAFNWYEKNASDNYFSDIDMGDQSPLAYLNSRVQQTSSESSTENVTSDATNSIRNLASNLSLVDGRKVTDFSTSLPGVSDVNSAATLLSTSWMNYYELKQQYTVEYPYELLKLNLDYLIVADGYTVNEADDAIVIRS